MFEICCIPFFVYDLALGDLVETNADYSVTLRHAPSGRFVFRVWFGDSFHSQEEIADDLQALGALWNGPKISWPSMLPTATSPK